MNMHGRRWLPLFGLGALLAGCDDGVEPPLEDDSSVRLLLVHRQDTGRNVFVRTDGAQAGILEVRDSGLIPIGISPNSGTVALLVPGDAFSLALTTPENPQRLDTIVDPLPVPVSLATVSEDDRFVALVSHAAGVRGVLLYDRASDRLDTVPYGTPEPVLPPVISPDNSMIGLVGTTGLSLLLTVFFPDDLTRSDTEVLSITPLLNRPMLGWPRWTEEGLLLAFVRLADEGPDTLVAGLADPLQPGNFFEERFRAVMAPVSDARPPLGIGSASTYAFSADGRALVLGAQPGPDPERHALYLVTPDIDRVQLLLDDPDQFLAFPLFVR